MQREPEDLRFFHEIGEEAYDRAIGLLSIPGIERDSIRLDRYYPSPSYMDEPGDTRVYLIPKKNATLNRSQKWKDTMKEFVENTMPYLEQYHQRSNSESGTCSRTYPY